MNTVIYVIANKYKIGNEEYGNYAAYVNFHGCGAELTSEQKERALQAFAHALNLELDRSEDERGNDKTLL